MSRHGVKRYHELGVKIARLSDEEDQNRWEASKKLWEESGKKAIYEEKKRKQQEEAIKAAAVPAVVEAVAETPATPEEPST